MKKVFMVIVRLCALFFLIIYPQIVNAQPLAPQTVGGVIQQEKEQQIQRKIQERVEKEVEAPAQEVIEQISAEDVGPKVIIKKITVEGYTLLTNQQMQKLVVPFEGKELSVTNMKKIADLITDEYRKKGYPTSRAFLPPQRIQNNELLIRVVEGTLGDVKVRGNKYFKSALIKKKLELRPLGIFDYGKLQRDLVAVNEHPDRFAKIVLTPGKKPGTTDVIIDIEDRLPVHFVTEYDNYAPRTLERNRYSAILEHNNLLGFDDKLRVKGQFGEAHRMALAQGRYLFPISSTLEAGFYFMYSNTRLGRPFEALEPRGEAQVYGLFATQALYQTSATDIRFNMGFDHKSYRNELSGAESSHDELRVFKAGLDVDHSDGYGRTIFTAELDVGVPDLFGGMEAKDPSATRTGAGGQFQKGVFNLFRLQPGFLGTSILWKNTAQFTNHNMTAAEQFQIGGPISVRGYPVSEHAGDRGYYTAFEWSLPFYGLNKSTKVPFSDVKLFDALRFVIFYDWATVNTKTVSAGEDENETLHGCGAGLRLNVQEDLAVRIEVGHPLGSTPSDAKKFRPWVEFVWRF